MSSADQLQRLKLVGRRNRGVGGHLQFSGLFLLFGGDGIDIVFEEGEIGEGLDRHT